MIPLAPRKDMKSRYHHSKFLSPSSPAVIDPVNVVKKDETVSNNGWRRYGIARRKHLIAHDTAEGGNHFDLNFQCRIQGYFALSEKIISKFDDSFANGNDLEATYVMGHRLVHFLTEALPRHPAYMRRDPVVSRLREKSFNSLARIKKQLDAISLRIDEEELNSFILHDFDPFADDDDSCSSAGSDADREWSSSDGRRKEGLQWESFGGWSFDLPDMTEPSSFAKDVPLLSCQDVDESGDTEDTFSSETSHGSDDQEPIYSHGLEFLKQISSEAVRYETDSEANDSWAQELEDELEDCLSNIEDMSYDPSRVALQEMMINKRREPSKALQRAKNLLREYVHEQPDEDGKENQSLDFDLSPDNTFDAAEEEDIWIAFDPTARLPEVSTESLERASL